MKKAVDAMINLGKFKSTTEFKSFRVKGYLLYSSFMLWRRCVLFTEDPEKARRRIGQKQNLQSQNSFPMSMWSCKRDIKASMANDATPIFIVFSEKPPYLPLMYQGFYLRREFFYAKEFASFIQQENFKNIFVYTLEEHAYDWTYHLAGLPIECGEVNTIKNAMLSEGLVENIKNKVKFCLENVHYLISQPTSYPLKSTTFNILGKGRAIPQQHKAKMAIWYVVLAQRDHYRYDQLVYLSDISPIIAETMEAYFLAQFQQYFSERRRHFAEVHHEDAMFRSSSDYWSSILLLAARRENYDVTSKSLRKHLLDPFEPDDRGDGLILYNYHIKYDIRDLAAQNGTRDELRMFLHLSREFSCGVFFSEYPYKKQLESSRFIIHDMEQTITFPIITMQALSGCMPDFILEHDVFKNIIVGAYDNLEKNVSVTFVFPREIHNIEFKGAIDDMLDQRSLFRNMTNGLKRVNFTFFSGVYYNARDGVKNKHEIFHKVSANVHDSSEILSPPYVKELVYASNEYSNLYNMVIPAMYTALEGTKDYEGDQHFIIGLTEFEPADDTLSSLNIMGWTGLDRDKYKLLLVPLKSLIIPYLNRQSDESLRLKVLERYNNLGARIVTWIIDNLALKE